MESFKSTAWTIAFFYYRQCERRCRISRAAASWSTVDKQLTDGQGELMINMYSACESSDTYEWMFVSVPVCHGMHACVCAPQFELQVTLITGVGDYSVCVCLI